MRYSVLGTNYVIRLDAGEKVVESLLSLCEREGIGSGFFNGLGAVGEAELGHFDPSSNDYSWVKLSGSYEIVSLYGNIAVVDGKGANPPIRYDPATRVFTMGAESDYGGAVYTAVLSPDGKRLTKGTWRETDRSSNEKEKRVVSEGEWSATRIEK
jgi:hypothetical protein